MTATQPPVGSRGNGLSAGGWALVADCDPRIADELLSLLADAAIAACAAPSTGERGGYLEVRLPRRPVDRLYVDAARRGDAERLVRTRLQEPLGTLEGPAALSANDEAFAAIVAGWSIQQVGDWPEAENVLPDEPAKPERRRPTGARGPDVGSPQRDVGGFTDEPQVAAASPRADPFDDDDNHYQPPPPPPAPRLRTATKVAWIAIVLGVAALLTVPLGWVYDGQLADLAGGLFIFGGVGSLVYHLREDSPRDGPDGGAVV